jgi:V/A-type H+-transporting ATPase subunit F
MYKKIGVVGDKDSVLAFKALGIDVFPVVEADEAKKQNKNEKGLKERII